MLTYEEALERILRTVKPLEAEQGELSNALGRVICEDVVSSVNLPPFDNSAMDGYAVRTQDVRTIPLTLPVSGEIAAGASDLPVLAPGTAMKIMTGAPLPQSADAVVPMEDVDAQERQVTLREIARRGQFVRPLGDDISAGALAVTQGTELRPAHIGLLAAIGRESVSVCAHPRVAIVSTGDELVEPGATLQPGQIYNSNAYALAAQVTEAGGIVVQRHRAGDTLESLRTAFDACAGADVLITSGGVSVGDYDYVKDVFAERGAVDFWRVAIRPGKPLAFGAWGKTLFFGLPGNPVSSMVTFELFVRPALLKMRGVREPFRPLVQAQLTEGTSHGPGRRSYQRARARQEAGQWIVTPIGRQGSHMMGGMTEANSLLIVPHDVEVLPAGEYATVMLL